MADLRSVVVITLILLLGGSVGALAGYRLYVQAEVLPEAKPIVATVLIEWPDGGNVTANVSVAGLDRTAFGALVSAGDVLNVTVRWRDYRDDAYVFQIGDHTADGACGWLYSVNGTGAAFQPTNAANKEFLDDGDLVVWTWGCV